MKLCWVYSLCPVSVSRSVIPGSLRPHGLQPTRLLCPWDSPGKDTGVDCHFDLQHWAGWVANPMWLVSLQKEETWTQTPTQWQHHVKTGVTLPQARKLPEARREAWNASSPRACEAALPCRHLVLRLLTSEQWDYKFLLFKPPSLWYSVIEILAD